MFTASIFSSSHSAEVSGCLLTLSFTCVSAISFTEFISFGIHKDSRASQLCLIEQVNPDSLLSFFFFYSMMWCRTTGRAYMNCVWPCFTSCVFMHVFMCTVCCVCVCLPLCGRLSFVGLCSSIRPDSAEGFSSCPSAGSRNEEKDWENDSTTSSTPSNTEYTGRHQEAGSAWSVHLNTPTDQFYICVFA